MTKDEGAGMVQPGEGVSFIQEGGQQQDGSKLFPVVPRVRIRGHGNTGEDEEALFLYEA